jgi:hypothetical protein
MKKSYTSAFKAQVVLELLKDEKSLNQPNWCGSKKLASTLTRHERRAMIEPAHPAVPLVAQADILCLSRSSL